MTCELSNSKRAGNPNKIKPLTNPLWGQECYSYSLQQTTALSWRDWCSTPSLSVEGIIPWKDMIPEHPRRLGTLAPINKCRCKPETWRLTTVNDSLCLWKVAVWLSHQPHPLEVCLDCPVCFFPVTSDQTNILTAYLKISTHIIILYSQHINIIAKPISTAIANTLMLILGTPMIKNNSLQINNPVQWAVAWVVTSSLAGEEAPL